MLQRCFYKKEKQREPTYKDATCCQEWLYYPNFHEWLHSQENFDKWYNGEQWAVDKDIFMKGNKTYSPDTCCLVPYNVNNLFTKHDNARGIYPIGVHWHSRDNMFTAQCMNPFTKKRKFLGYHETINDAFQAYKKYKESIIKQVADVEYSKRNITKKCYDAMMNYEVEITD